MLIILACGSPETGLSETLLRMKHRLQEQRAQRNMRKDYDEYKSLISHVVNTAPNKTTHISISAQSVVEIYPTNGDTDVVTYLWHYFRVDPIT